MTAIYDLVFTKDAIDYSYMLKQEGQTKDFRVVDSPLLPQTLVTESASPSNIQPEREIQISQVDWRKGIQDYLFEDEHKYNESENCDARMKGQVILSPKKLTAMSFGTEPTAPTLTDGGIENWTNPTTPANWTETGDTVGSSTTKHGGTYSAKGGNGSNGDAGTIYQDIWTVGNLPTMWQGKHIKISAWGYHSHTPDASNYVKLTVSDNADSTTATITTSAITWQQGSVVHKLSAAATQLRITLEWKTLGGGDYAYMDDVTIDYYPDYAAVVDEVEFGDDVVVAMGNCLFNITTGSAVYVYSFPKTITDLCVYQNRLYIAQGWSDAFYYTSDLVTFTVSTLTGGVTDNVSATTADYSAVATSVAVVDGTVFSATPFYARWGNEVISVTTVAANTLTVVVRGQLGSTAAAHLSGTSITELATVTGAKYMSNIGGSQFWISDSNNTLRDSDNPINNGTPFSSAYTVGSDDWDITGLVDHEDTVFVRKEDQVYYLSVADVLPLLPIASEASTTYTYGLYAWGDCLYIPSGVNSLYEYDISTGTVTTISPVRYCPGDANYDENITAITNDESYLYICMNNGTGIRILSGRWENVDGDTDWWWHPLYTKTSNNVTSMLISSNSGSKRLYAGTDTYTDGIYPFIVPTAYSAIYNEAGMEFEASGTFITPWYTSNFPTEKKYWKSIDITSICCTDKTSITPYYQVKGGVWVAMTACTTSAYDGGYPAETTDSRTIGVSSERIRFKFVMAAAVDEYTPILYGSGGGLVTFGVLQADRKREIDATILVAPKIRLRDDTVVERVIATDLTNLRTLYQSNAKITLTAPDETEYSVIFMREGYSEQLAYWVNPDGKITNEEHWWVSVRLLEV